MRVGNMPEPMTELRRWMSERLAEGWTRSPRRRPLVEAAIGHALNFRAWQSLAHADDLDDGAVIHLMVCLVRCAAAR
jgi:hypothetical protein